jgi:hypothetical protein
MSKCQGQSGGSLKKVSANFEGEFSMMPLDMEVTQTCG